MEIISTTGENAPPLISCALMEWSTAQSAAMLTAIFERYLPD
jgi:hypothetical protein